MLRAVLFDLDDTLFDHCGCARLALIQLRQRYRCFESRTLEDLERDYHRLLEELHLKVLSGTLTLEASRLERFRQLLVLAGATPDPDDAQAAAVARAYHEAYLAAYRPVPGAVPLLRALKARNIKTGIVTNNIVAEQVRKLKACGMEELIDALVVSEEAGAIKPDPAIFQLALDRLGCRAAEAVMIGDAWAGDILGARNAGIRPIWFNPRGLPSPDPALAEEIRALEPMEAVLQLIFKEGGSRNT